MNKIEAVLDKLEHVQNIGGDRWRAKCPVHGGKSNTSLTIEVGHTHPVMLSCWAGCKTEQIIEALGIGWRDILNDGPWDRNEAAKRKQEKEKIRARVIIDLARAQKKPLTELDKHILFSAVEVISGKI